MAKIVSNFTDKRKVAYVDSYWRLTSVSFDLNSQNGTFIFSAFPDKTISESAKLDPKIESLATVSASVSGAIFIAYYIMHIKARLNISELAYKIADDQGLFKGAVDDTTIDVVSAKAIAVKQ